MTRGIATSAAALVALGAADAGACSIVFGGELVQVFPRDVTVPSNLPAFVWSGTVEPQLFWVGENDFRLTPTSVAARDERTQLLTVSEELESKSEYRITSPSCTGTPLAAFRVDTSTPAALPESIGTLIAKDPRRGYVPTPTGSGSCSSSVDGMLVEIDVELSDQAMPWREAFLWTTRVDGELWRPYGSLAAKSYLGSGSWVGRGRDVVYARCSEPVDDATTDEGVTPGVHDVVLTAELPGAVTLSTEAITIDLTCLGEELSTEDFPPSDEVFDWEPSRPVVTFERHPAPGEECNADEGAAGAPPAAEGDGGASGDRGSTPRAPESEAPDVSRTSRGCGCRVGDRRGVGEWAVVLLAVAALCRRRVRRAQKAWVGPV